MSEFPISLIVQPSGSRNVFIHQYSCDLGSPCTVIGKVKDFLDNPACLRIHHNGVLDFGMSDISKGRIGKGAFSCGKFRMECGLDLAAGVLGKPFIEQIFERNEIGQAFLGILVLGHGDISHLLLRELIFQILSDHDIITSEAAEVFCDDAVYSSCIHIFHHTLEIRSFKRSATPSVVDVLTDHMKIVVLCELL